MTTAQPGQEQRMVTISHQMYLFLMGEGSLDGTWFGDNPCPTVAKGAFWWRSALRRYATRPTADLGDDGELEVSANADDFPSFVVGFLGARVDHTCDHPDEIVNARLDEIERRIIEIEASRSAG